MTIRERSEKIARSILASEWPYKAYSSGDALAKQQKRVLELATTVVEKELREFAEEIKIKFD